MDGLKGFAEVAKHILYETFGLLIPGGLAALAIAVSADPGWSRALLAFARENPWLAVGGAYVLGYLVQGLARPVNAVAEWVLRLPAKALGLSGRLVPEFATTVRGWTWRLERALTNRHAHSSDRGEARVDFDDLIRAYWKRRLGLDPHAVISGAQIRNLTFSQLLEERSGLDRFRAATSLTRAVGSVAAVVVVVLLVQVLRAERELTWQLVGVIELLVIAFYGALERADMYDDLWRSSLKTQFLCAVSRGQPLDPYSGLGSRDTTAPDAASRRLRSANGTAHGDGRGQSPPTEAEAVRGGHGAEPLPEDESVPSDAPTSPPIVPAIPTLIAVSQENRRV